MPTVEIQNASLTLGHRRILDGTSVTFRGPGLVVVTGPSGAGKTTLLHVIAGLVPLDKGDVSVAAESGQFPAWVVQNSPLMPRRSARENVAIGAAAAGEDWQLAQDLASPIMAALGISHTKESPAYRLSGGEKQRVAVARAIAARSDLILADEPTASLDEGSRDLVCDALRKAADSGCLVLVTTHDPEVADRADTVFALTRGKLKPGHRSDRDGIDA